MKPNDDPTRDPEYARRLIRLQTARWKQRIGVQLPYRWHLQRLRLGRTLDVGCGIGRNLAWLPPGSFGVDHNPEAVRFARQMSLDVYLPEELLAEQPPAGQCDSLLVAHVLEHLEPGSALELLRKYAPYLKPGGRIVLIAPQERGYSTDATHVAFLDEKRLGGLLRQIGQEVIASYSFPLPRFFGRLFTYNEFVVIGRAGRTSASAG